MFAKSSGPFRWEPQQIEFYITTRTHCLAHQQSEKAPLFTQDIKRTNRCSEWVKRGPRCRYFIFLIVCDYLASFRVIILLTRNLYLLAWRNSGGKALSYLHRPGSKFITTNDTICRQGRCTVFNSPRGRHANILIVGSNVKRKIQTHTFLWDQPCPLLRNSRETLRQSQARTREVLRFKLFYFSFFAR